MLRLSLHRRPGAAPGQPTQWRHHLFERLRQQISVTADPVLTALLEELRSYPVPPDTDQHMEGELPGVVMPFRLRTPHGVLSFISTITILVRRWT